MEKQVKSARAGSTTWEMREPGENPDAGWQPAGLVVRQLRKSPPRPKDVPAGPQAGHKGKTAAATGRPELRAASFWPRWAVRARGTRQLERGHRTCPSQPRRHSTLRALAGQPSATLERDAPQRLGHTRWEPPRWGRLGGGSRRGADTPRGPPGGQKGPRRPLPSPHAHGSQTSTPPRIPSREPAPDPPVPSSVFPAATQGCALRVAHTMHLGAHWGHLRCGPARVPSQLWGEGAGDRQEFHIQISGELEAQPTASQMPPSPPQGPRRWDTASSSFSGPGEPSCAPGPAAPGKAGGGAGGGQAQREQGPGDRPRPLPRIKPCWRPR